MSACDNQRGISRVGATDIGAFESQGFTLAVTSGNSQSTPINTAFTAPLVVTVTSVFPEPVAGGKVTFTPPGSGASAALTANPATLASNGTASVTATANGTLGQNYAVTASSAGLRGSVSFTLSNTEAPSLVVTTTADANNPYDGLTSLREAIAYADTLSGHHDVTFAPGVTGVIDLMSALPALTGDVALVGPGAASLTVQRDAAAAHFSVFTVSANATVGFSGLTISGGYSDADGGGIHANSGSSVMVTNSTLTGNSASYRGGSIYTDFGSSLTMINSTLASNSAPYGGGIYANSSTLTVTNSILTDNSAISAGGGIFANYTTTVTNSTLTGNSAQYGYGGGIYANSTSTVTVTNGTLTGNSAQYGGGIYANSSTVTLSNGILWGNTAQYTGVQIYGSATVNYSDVQGGWAGAGNINVDPRLTALGNYGGPTQTVALLPGSPAISTGNANLQAWWKFDEGTGSTATDSSPNHFDATLVGATWSADRPANFPTGNSLHFAGNNNYALLPNADLNRFTVTAWVKRDTVNSAPDAAILLSVNNGGWGIGFKGNANHDSIFLTQTGVGHVDSVGTITDTANWHQVAVSYDGTYARFYIDGHLDSTVYYGVHFSSNNGNYAIGDRGPLGGAAFHGNLDDMRLFNTVLTDGQIASIYSAPPTDQRGVNRNALPDMGAYEFFGVAGVTSSKANGAYTVGAVIPIQVTFSENVTVTGTPRLTLNNGAVVDYSGGCGSTTLTFDYTVAAGQDVADLDYTTATSLAPNGGTIRDGAGTDVSLTLPDPGGTGSLGANKNIVIDTVAPTLSLPANLTAEAGAASGAVVVYTASADDVGGSGIAAISSLPASGSTFALSTTTVNVSATDNAGNTATGSFLVTVVDTAPPSITGTPANRTVYTTDPTGALVTWAAPTANDLVSGSVPVTADHASGSLFALGTTTVTLTAKDAAGNTATSSFVVTVQEAPSLVVTTTTDSLDPLDLKTSLREAIAYADTLSGHHDITFASGVTGVLDLMSALPTLTRDIALVGPGAANLTVQRDAAALHFGVIRVAANDMARISGLTIAGGYSDSDGGGIYVDYSSTFTVTDSTLTGNNSGGYGGGIYAGCYSTVTVINSTLTGNSAEYGGGGIIANDSSIVTVTNSTLTGNSAATWGGGIFAPGNVAVINSTLTSNSAADKGGAIYAYDDEVYPYPGIVTLINSTLVGNSSANAGAGIYADRNTATLTNTLVARNTLTDNVTPSDIGGTLDATSSYNLIGDGSGVLNPALHNLLGSMASPLEPLLAPLGDYGGPTQTMPLLPGSPALNAGTSGTGSPTADQRGISRVGATDIGAFESQGFTLAVTSGNSQSTPINTPFTAPLVVTVTSVFPEPVAGGKITFTPPGTGASAALTANLKFYHNRAAAVAKTMSSPTCNSRFERISRIVILRLMVRV